MENNLIIAILPLFVMICFGIIFGLIAIKMAKKRRMNTTAAFFSGLFGSFLALFFIALFPIKDTVNNDSSYNKL